MAYQMDRPQPCQRDSLGLSNHSRSLDAWTQCCKNQLACPVVTQEGGLLPSLGPHEPRSWGSNSWLLEVKTLLNSLHNVAQFWSRIFFLKCTDIFEYFMQLSSTKSLPDIEDLISASRRLHQTFLTTCGIYYVLADMTIQSNWADNVPLGSSWSPPPDIVSD